MTAFRDAHYPYKDWQDAVAHGDTVRGYGPWVLTNYEADRRAVPASVKIACTEPPFKGGVPPRRALRENEWRAAVATGTTDQGYQAWVATAPAAAVAVS
jgi:hypothetical protein